ncbi:transglutaminase-like domain-containing protein [Limnoglobus roseus]|uniref:Transglutaminase family protein n=1 Tax=Limnoglobus roseus TaxID=2598579 RepID=A0A5C1AFV6_9BACT|nr:transglutaminase family protein [Limnoglobus roseus]QEL17700.1 transglutaminase family protein [Limnoglobus roseus]
MLIQVDCEIALAFPEPAAVVLMLNLHPSVSPRVRRAEQLSVEPSVPVAHYRDVHGNHCSRVFMPAGRAVFRHAAVVEDVGFPDPQDWTAYHHRVQDLPDDTLLFLLPSRYCEVDSELKETAWAMFGHLPAGWPLVRTICDFVHGHIRFDYLQARANRTALESFRERVGVCRDFTHLAVTLCRCLNVPARYCAGYLGDIGVPIDTAPMDFSAWFEVYLGGRWYAFDARHNVPRIGRVLMACGRDAADVALTTAFGVNRLESFRVGTVELPAFAPGGA